MSDSTNNAIRSAAFSLGHGCQRKQPSQGGEGGRGPGADEGETLGAWRGREKENREAQRMMGEINRQEDMWERIVGGRW